MGIYLDGCNIGDEGCKYLKECCWMKLRLI